MHTLLTEAHRDARGLTIIEPQAPARQPGLPLSAMLIGDLFAPHYEGERKYTYLGSVMLIDGLLAEVDISQVLGGFVDPWNTMLTAEEVSAIRDASRPAPDARALLAKLEDDTFVMYSEFGDANLNQYLIVHDPGLAAELIASQSPMPAPSIPDWSTVHDVRGEWITWTAVAIMFASIAALVVFVVTR